MTLVVRNSPANAGESHKRCMFHPQIRKIPWRRAWQFACVLARRIPWTEGSGGLQSQRVRLSLAYTRTMENMHLSCRGCANPQLNLFSVAHKIWCSKVGENSGFEAAQNWIWILTHWLHPLWPYESYSFFPGGPVVKTPCFQCRGHEFDPWLEN